MHSMRLLEREGGVKRLVVQTGVVYYVSHRDGFRCIWAQRLPPQPSSHSAIKSPYTTSTTGGFPQ